MPHATDRILLLPLADITPGDNDRLAFNEDALRELAESIASIGLAQPITVRPLYGDGEPLGVYQIVAGERRFRACKLLGMETIPALVREMSDTDAAAVMLAENLQRVDISPLEAARAFRKRIDQFGWTTAEIASHANVRPELVTRRLRLLGLCPEAAMLLERQNLPIGHAEVMAALDSNRQMMALRLFQGARAPSLAEFRAYCSQLAAEQSQESMFDLTEFTLETQAAADADRMTRRTSGAKVSDEFPAATPKPSAGAMIESYIADLMNAGNGASARALCNLYDGMVRAGLVRIPTERALPEALTDGYVRPPRNGYRLETAAA